MDWGDGASGRVTVDDRAVTASHAYAGPGDYEITVAVSDDDGGTGARKTVVSVVAVEVEHITD